MTAEHRATLGAPLDPLEVDLAGRQLIEASAGTGKTFTIGLLYLRFLLERNLTVPEILVVTYTNAATAELRSRIRARLRQAAIGLEVGESRDATLNRLLQRRLAAGHGAADRRKLADALAQFDEAAIYTIHGFCQRVLGDNAFESALAFDSELVADMRPLLTDATRDFYVSRLHDASTAFIRFLERRRITVATLATLAERMIGNPRAVLKPDRPAAAPNATDREQQWHDAFRRASAAWKGERDKIVDLLCSPGCLNLNSYRPPLIRTNWAPALDVLFDHALPPLAGRFKQFENLTNDKLRARTSRKSTPPTHPFFDACSDLWVADISLEAGFEGSMYALLHDAVASVRSEIARRKAERGVQSFDDLLQIVHRNLRDPDSDLAAHIRQRYPAALIDEFQDTDPIQYEIFKTTHGEDGASLFLIGDPKQAIYGFRGAEVFTYIEAKRDAPEVEHSLAVNYRSDPGVLRAINALFEGARSPFVFDEISYRPILPAPDAVDRLAPSSSFEILWLDAQEAKSAKTETVAAAVAVDIARLLREPPDLGDRPLTASDIAVLCRTNRQARQMQEALRAHGLHSVLQTEDSVFDSGDATEVEHVLRAMLDPGDGRAVRNALVTSLFGIDAHGLEALEGNEADWDDWINRFQRWHQLWVERGFVSAMRAMLQDCDVPERLLRRPDGERRLTNVLQLIELVQTIAIQEKLGPETLARRLSQLRHNEETRADLAAEAAQIRLESDSSALKLVTIHKSKGLEFPIVYCPFLWDDFLLRRDDFVLRYHDGDSADRLVFFVATSKDEKERLLPVAEREALAENLRLLYVALTRARHRCSVVWGPIGKAASSAMAYLLHQPPNPDDERMLTDQVRARFPGLGDDGVLADVNAFVERTAGAASVRRLSLSDDNSAWMAATGDSAHFTARVRQRPVEPGPRLSSFTALSSTAADTEASAEGIDHDALAGRKEATPSGRDAATVTLSDFPAGARVGDVLHKILESLDFEHADAQATASVVARHLERAGMEPSYSGRLARAIDDVLATPLRDGDRTFSLRELAAAKRRAELEFLIPVGSDQHALAASALARVFAAHGSTRIPAAYVERLRQLRFQALSGYLRGFIDLVFEHGGRWYIVDYKSNLLGRTIDAYAPARLAEAMSQHHYFLQYHLYALALHRHLAARLPGYAYETHFGGVYYLFLRGMAPSHPAESGVFFDRPSHEMIEALDGEF